MIHKIRQIKDVFRRLAGQGVYPHQMAFLLDTRLRKFIITPAVLIDRLRLNDNSKVLEIGPGPGYFSIEVAKYVRNGFLVAYDIQKEMLYKINAKVKREMIQNLMLVTGNAEDLPFTDNYFDNVFMVTVIGEVLNQHRCLTSIKNKLRLGGILSITEMKGDPDVISEDALKAKVEAVGFKFLEVVSNSKGYTMNFSKC